MSLPAPALRYTYAEYLVRERESENKHEFVDGEIFAMAGGSAEHSIVAVNVVAELRNLLRGKTCQVFNSDMRIRNEDASSAYPDASALCGTPLFSDEQRDELCNPSLIVEVLSRTTEAYDRGNKHVHYASTLSIIEYVLVSVDKVRVELRRRQVDGSWVLRYLSKDDSLSLESVGICVPVASFYEGVPL